MLGRCSVVMVQPSQQRDGDDGAGAHERKALTRNGDTLAEPLVWPRVVEVAEGILPQYMQQMAIARDEHVVEALGSLPIEEGKKRRAVPAVRVSTSPDLRPRPVPATGPNQVWAYDFVFDACAYGQKLKCLTVVDEWTRESLAIDVAGSIRSSRVIKLLAKLLSVHGAPRYMRPDNGPEFVATAVLRWSP